LWATAADADVERWGKQKYLCMLSAKVVMVLPPSEWERPGAVKVHGRPAKTLRIGSTPADYLRALVNGGHGEGLAELGHDIEQLGPAPRREPVSDEASAGAVAAGAASAAANSARTKAGWASIVCCDCGGRGHHRCRPQMLSEADEEEETLAIGKVERVMKHRKKTQTDVARIIGINRSRLGQLLNRAWNIDRHTQSAFGEKRNHGKPLQREEVMHDIRKVLASTTLQTLFMKATL